MQHRGYLDFDLVIEAAAGAGKGSYQARVTKSPCGLEAQSPFSVPFTDDELAEFVEAVTPRGLTRRLAPTVPKPMPTVDVRTMGKRLFGAAFAGDLAQCLVDSVKSARSDHNKGVRVRLHLGDAPELGGIPWEFLFSDFLDRYVALSSDTPVVRYLDVPSADTPLPVTLPLRVVVMVSDPVDAPGLDVKRETELLQATTGDLQKAGLLSLEFLDAATLTNLQHRLYEPMHVFHFIGHGGFDVGLGQGTLLFEDDQKRAHPVSATRLATLLHDAPDLRLAVLNSCEGARGSSTDPFSGVAQTLLRQGLPSVVAMQSEISDRAAIAFAHEFYFALCRGAAVDAATSEGRKAVFTSGNDVEWGTPVLFLRSADAQLFEVADEPAEPSREEHWDSLYDAAQSALAVSDTTRARSLLEQLASESPDYKDVTALLPKIAEPVAPAPVPPGPTVPTPRPPVAPPPPPLSPRKHGGQQPPPTARRPRKKRHWVHKLVVLVLLAGIGLFGFGAYQRFTEYQKTVQAASLSGQLNIDGADGDWPSAAKSYHSDHFVAGPEDRGVSATWRVAWDAGALYVFARVQDIDPTFVNTVKPSTLFNGDSVHFELGADARNLDATAPLRPTDVHFMLGPVGNGNVVAATNRPIGGVFVAAVSPSITAKSLRGADGYTVEARIPWRLLKIDPKFGLMLAANFNVSDAQPAARAPATLRGMLSNNPKRDAALQNHPAGWYWLKLDSPSS